MLNPKYRTKMTISIKKLSNLKDSLIQITEHGPLQTVTKDQIALHLPNLIT